MRRVHVESHMCGFLFFGPSHFIFRLARFGPEYRRASQTVSSRVMQIPGRRAVSRRFLQSEEAGGEDGEGTHGGQAGGTGGDGRGGLGGRGRAVVAGHGHGHGDRSGVRLALSCAVALIARLLGVRGGRGGRGSIVVVVVGPVIAGGGCLGGSPCGRGGRRTAGAAGAAGGGRGAELLRGGEDIA